MLIRNILIAACLCGWCLTSPARAQVESLSVDPERELLVMFQPGVVTVPAGRETGPPDAFTVASPTLSSALGASRVEALARVIPDFQAEDRFSSLASGKTVELTDWSRVYLLRVPTEAERDKLIEVLNALPEVAYAEPNGRGGHDAVVSYAPLAKPTFSPLLVPNDDHFPRQWAWQNDGTALQGSGTPDADVDATEAWEITTGSSSVNIAIVDGGMQTDHPDFSGRVTGDPGDDDDHGTAVAGIAAATGNNGQGVAGMVWVGGIINEDYNGDFGNATDADFAAAVRSASTRGAHVINNSWRLADPVGRYSATVRLAFKDVYLQNRVAVVSMGNAADDSDSELQFPAGFSGVIAVGATTNTDAWAAYSSRGPHIDVAAPGGADNSQAQSDNDYFYTTFPNGYNYNYGTSFSAPIVSGLAALLLAVNPGLENDDIKAIIRLGVDDVNVATKPGFDNDLGTGRVNAKKALDLVRAPYTFARATATGGTDQGAGPYEKVTFHGAPGLADAQYNVRAHEVRKTVTYPSKNNVSVWGRHVGAVGWSRENPNVAVPFTEVVPGTVTSTSAQVRTYVYEVFDGLGRRIGWFPTTPQNVTFAYTVHGRPAPLSASIGGPDTFPPNEYATWWANASGGREPYAYAWSYRYPCADDPPPPPLPPCDPKTGVCTMGGGALPMGPTRCEWLPAGTSRAITRFFSPLYGSVDLRVRVTDDGGSSRTAYETVYASDDLTAGDGEQARGTGAEAEADVAAASRAGTSLPAAYALDGAAPNPFRGEASVGFALPEAAGVRLAVYDLLGREVAVLADGQMEAGRHRARFDGRGLPAGVYAVRLTANEFIGTARVTLLR
jgi:subtilisin family serine protease